MNGHPHWREGDLAVMHPFGCGPVLVVVDGWDVARPGLARVRECSGRLRWVSLGRLARPTARELLEGAFE